MKVRNLFIAGVACALLAVIFLRINAGKAISMRADILRKDQAAQDVTADIEALRQFVFKHMNSSVRFELTDGYNRAVAAAQTQGLAAGSQLYAEAQASCDRQGVSSVDQARCVQSYLESRLQPGQSSVPIPQRSTYTYAFVSPSWTPDIAGFLLLVAFGCGLAALVLYVWGLFRNREGNTDPAPTGEA
jgi:hypothetical protein